MDIGGCRVDFVTENRDNELKDDSDKTIVILSEICNKIRNFYRK